MHDKQVASFEKLNKDKSNLSKDIINATKELEKQKQNYENQCKFLLFLNIKIVF